MQNPSIWEKFRAFIHQKTAKTKPVNLPTLPNQYGPYTPTLGLLALAAIGWHIKTNPTYYNIYVYGGLALFVILPFTILALTQWRKHEDELKAEQKALREEQQALSAEQKALRRKGAIRNLWGFLFGENN